MAAPGTCDNTCLALSGRGNSTPHYLSHIYPLQALMQDAASSITEGIPPSFYAGGSNGPTYQQRPFRHCDCRCENPRKSLIISAMHSQILEEGPRYLLPDMCPDGHIWDGG